MEHSEAAQLITDWVGGRLDADLAGRVASHVRSCAECAAVEEAARVLAEDGAPHPAADEIASLALDPAALPEPRQRTLRAHLLACASCENEFVLAREAAAPSVLRRIQARWLETPTPQPWARAVPYALAALLLYPAYLGLVRYPLEHAAGARGAAELRTLEQRVGELESGAREGTPWSGGGTDVVLLRGASRGAAALPTARVRPGQPAQPILIDYSPARLADSLAIAILREDGSPVWQLRGPASGMWDATSHVIAVLVPAALLPPGVYRVTVTPAGTATPEFGASFRIAAP